MCVGSRQLPSVEPPAQSFAGLPVITTSIRMVEGGVGTLHTWDSDKSASSVHLHTIPNYSKLISPPLSSCTFEIDLTSNGIIASLLCELWTAQKCTWRLYGS